MPVSERAPRPRSEYAPPLRTIFSRIAATTALVLCDRDNLSPLKEFRDISSSRVRSVAKTRRNSDRRRGRCCLHPLSPPPTPLHPLGRHLAKIRPTRKKSVRSTAIITWCACYADYATVCCCRYFYTAVARTITWPWFGTCGPSVVL